MENVLTATLVLYLIISSVENEVNGCIYSWNLGQNGTTCSVHCPTSFHIKFNAHCNFLALKSLNLNYDSSSQILSVPSGTSMSPFAGGSTIPSCYKVTLNEGQYEITSDVFVRISQHLMEIAPHLSTYSGGSITICYPSSPQLLQCDVIRIPLGSYKIVNGTQLAIFEKNYTVSLGDFFIDENKMAVTCAESVTNQLDFGVIPRCNVISVSPNDIRMHADGSITLLKANFTIKKPIYSVNYTEFLLVCVPLTSEFLNCPTKKKVQDSFYVSLTNLGVVDIFYDQTTVSPDSYYITMDGELVTCVSHTNGGLSPYFRVSFSMYYVSSVFIILTLIIRFPMFVQSYQGLYLILHVLSLMVVCLNTGSRIFTATIKAIPCYLIFGSQYFFVMATVIWLNVITYDSWSYFSHLSNHPNRPRSTTNAFKRCVIYNVIVWGISSILTSIVLTIDLIGPPFDFNTPFQLNIIAPQFPYNYTIWCVCFFNNWRTINLFYSLPLVVFSVVNIGFIVLTIRCIHRAGRGTELVNHRRHRQLFEISIRLFLVMGFCWTVDCLSFLIGAYTSSVYHMYYVVIAVAVVAFQGVLIFIVYCGSKEVFQSFFQKLL